MPVKKKRKNSNGVNPANPVVSRTTSVGRGGPVTIKGRRKTVNKLISTARQFGVARALGF